MSTEEDIVLWLQEHFHPLIFPNLSSPETPELDLESEEIEGSLDDAFYSLPEYNANVDSRDYIDSARSELYCLKEDIEKSEKKT